MSSPASKGRIPSTLRSFLDTEASSGLILMAVAALALCYCKLAARRNLLPCPPCLLRTLEPSALDQRRAYGSVLPDGGA
jgi:hypothetical protein